MGARLLSCQNATAGTSDERKSYFVLSMRPIWRIKHRGFNRITMLCSLLREGWSNARGVGKVATDIMSRNSFEFLFFTRIGMRGVEL